MDIKLRVGSRIKDYRQKKNLSQEKLSLISNVDRTYIASVEAGNRNISIEALEKIIIGLDITLREFFSTFD